MRLISTNPAAKPLICNAVLPASMLKQWWHEALESNQTASDLTQDPLLEMKTIHDTVWVTKNPELDNPET